MKKFIHVDGFHCRSVEEKISTALRNRNGKLDTVTDKGAVFEFNNHDDAWMFEFDLRQMRVFTRDTV